MFMYGDCTEAWPGDHPYWPAWEEGGSQSGEFMSREFLLSCSFVTITLALAPLAAHTGSLSTVPHLRRGTTVRTMVRTEKVSLQDSLQIVLQFVFSILIVLLKHWIGQEVVDIPALTF